MKRFLSTLVVVENKNGKIASSTFNTVAAAYQLKPKSLSVFSFATEANKDKLLNQLKSIPGVGQIYLTLNESFNNPQAENLSNALKSLQEKKKFECVLAFASPFGKDLMPRFAASIDVGQVSDVISVVDSSSFVRPIYAGNALETVKSLDNVKVLTIRSSAFQAVSISKTPSDIPVEIVSAPISDKVKFIKEELSAGGDRPELGSAKIVVSGGRGLKSGDNFKILYELADKLQAGVGASRAAVDAGFVPNDLQIGQTGKIVAPDLYIAVGISGAIQHLAGMKDSKVIVAINKDPEAPIFQVADYGLVEDLFKAVPELTKKL